ncbi:hypothetical protein FD13_GL001967 [Levilactobacillus senmaizukei DSM 21775 = NBRC 103853]|uniref:PhnB-like domain-containing protein n=1 Tax=Levilactobacillus senmaizukei DSM 21775 = NBRC 103853 TaxID=1423803 RepID=A0A0R2DG45_9LACO|nr:VOC family protein [Levilactobacillus senmaizukei]KRN02291.1 hypothetical protein FD13_GL001967 [Levilactobacillus senmaizukei DSM 21775 = NBRC 103853]
MHAPITYLAFKTTAKAAIEFYTTVFPNTTLKSINYYPDRPKLVLNSEVDMQGVTIGLFDMGADEDAPIDWGTSLYIECDSVVEFQTIFDQLAAAGHVMMGPMAMAGFTKVTWVTDKFGVTWQLVAK